MAPGAPGVIKNTPGALAVIKNTTGAPGVVFNAPQGPGLPQEIHPPLLSLGRPHTLGSSGEVGNLGESLGILHGASQS